MTLLKKHCANSNLCVFVQFVGGGSNEAPPSDIPPGGGLPQYYPWYQQPGFGEGIAKGFQQFGAGVAGGGAAPMQFQTPQIPYNPGSQSQYQAISTPESQLQISDIMDILRRLGVA